MKPLEAARFHFKLGHGSLADVQFATELLLLRYAGADEELRTPRTLQAIERLAERRLVEQTVARDLGEAFVFLADVKNATPHQQLGVSRGVRRSARRLRRFSAASTEQETARQRTDAHPPRR